MRRMLVWMDLEMTGLDPARHVIVEIATIVTDDDLEVVAEGPDLVVHQPDEALAAMDDVVREMHTKSGLLEAIEASTITLADAGAATLAFIKEHVPEPRTVPLCGNSIGTDRRFLAVYLPTSRSTCTTGRSTCRRSRSSPGAGTRRSSPTSPARRLPTAPSTTSARASRSCASTASTCSCPAASEPADATQSPAPV